MRKLLAIDLGASSGRVILGTYQENKLTLEEIHRFENSLQRLDNHVCWDTNMLLREIKAGCEIALDRDPRIDCMAIDTWGVDYVFIDASGKKVDEAISYRDARTSQVFESVTESLTKEFIYNKTGIQFLPFNTLYQLAAVVKTQPSWLSQVDKLLLIPDYLNFELSGVKGCEYTNASTTQLLNCHTGLWDQELLELIDIPKSWLLPPQQPNHIIGTYNSNDGKSIPLASIASHDTASAILALPVQGDDAIYISSGTWSLMGFESVEPIINGKAKAINVTNEGGAEKRYRVLKNIMGLWLIQNVQKELNKYSFAELVTLAEAASPVRSLIDPDHISFLNPKSMIDAIQTFCSQTKQAVPESPGELALCIFESLALQYRKVFEELASIKLTQANRIHIIGGGTQNTFLSQLCADATGMEVTTGPIEASAIGNLCGQLIALGEVKTVSDARTLVAHSFPTQNYIPQNTDRFNDKWPEFIRICQY
ncbi:rhamnulokinase [Vibrio sp. 10N.222.51.C12]|uniref:rhamnulokinase n=1 Tax=unclassified Vibrio TaxID=2614977 RepID=UPI000C85E69C|nr:rhamnulokinase [Vibrio sp. 10N.286.48.B7]PMH83337.1 rhamnulokinase [Vibrio sp. 10N.286.48.B7]